MQIETDEALALLVNSTVIILRRDETRPRTVGLFDSEEERRLATEWIASHPELTDLLEHAKLLSAARSIELADAEAQFDQIADGLELSDE